MQIVTSIDKIKLKVYLLNYYDTYHMIVVLGISNNFLKNDERLLSSEGKANDATEGVVADRKCTLKKLQRSKEQIQLNQLNDIATSYFWKERLFMLRARHLRYLICQTKHKYVVPLHGAATPLLMNMQLVTPNTLLLTGPSDPNQGYSGACSQETPITPSGNCLQLFPSRSSQNDSQGDAWVDLELDSLWISVRWHDVGNWESLIKDPQLRFCASRKPKDLLERWRVEKLKGVYEVRSNSFLHCSSHFLLGFYWWRGPGELLIKSVPFKCGQLIMHLRK